MCVVFCVLLGSGHAASDDDWLPTFRVGLALRAFVAHLVPRATFPGAPHGECGRWFGDCARELVGHVL
eukprot:8512030-Lingulodinium_polyedra.AAC.1